MSPPATCRVRKTHRPCWENNPSFQLYIQWLGVKQLKAWGRNQLRRKQEMTKYDLPQDVISHIFCCFWIHFGSSKAGNLVGYMHLLWNMFPISVVLWLCILSTQPSQRVFYVCACFSNHNPCRSETLESISTKIARKPCKDWGHKTSGLMNLWKLLLLLSFHGNWTLLLSSLSQIWTRSARVNDVCVIVSRSLYCDST